MEAKKAMDHLANAMEATLVPVMKGVRNIMTLWMIKGWTFSGAYETIEGIKGTFTETYIPIANYIKAYEKFIEQNQGKQVQYLMSMPDMQQVEPTKDNGGEA